MMLACFFRYSNGLIFARFSPKIKKMTADETINEESPLVEDETQNQQSQSGDNQNSEHSHSHHNDDHHHRFVSLSEHVPIYSRPKQRQRWGEQHILPHVNWGDLFFDLFYVAAAYNLDGIMEHDPSLRGLLYYVCCYLPIYFIWVEKLAYDAKFAPDDNLFHRGWDIVHLGILGTIVQHVQTVQIMSQTSKYPTTMVFAGGLCVESWSQLLRYKDVYHNVDGFRPTIHVVIHIFGTKMCITTWMVGRKPSMKLCQLAYEKSWYPSVSWQQLLLQDTTISLGPQRRQSMTFPSFSVEYPTSWNVSICSSSSSIFFP